MKRALWIALCFYVGTAGAANIDPRIAELDVCGRFETWHVNGILTDRQGATDNLTRIKTDYGNAHKGHLISYNLAHNPTVGPITDIVQSANQVIIGYVGATWDNFMQAATFGIYSVMMPTTTAKAIAKAVTDKYGFTKVFPYQDSDIGTMINAITSLTAWGSKKVFVCHSQGNLYCNLIYDRLVAAGQPPQSIGLVGVAVPYSSLRTGNNYITSSNDVVIDMVRIATANYILPANVTIPYNRTVDIIGHKFIPTYMAHSTTKTKILLAINDEFESLKTIIPSPVWAPYYTYNKVSWLGSCTPAYPCYRDNAQGISVAYPSPILWHPIVNSPYNMVTQAGTLAQATSAALSNGQLCYSATIAEELRIRLGQSLPTGRAIWGCLVIPNNRPSEGTWHAYSGDLAPSFKATYYASSNSVDVIAGATCRR